MKYRVKSFPEREGLDVGRLVRIDVAMDMMSAGEARHDAPRA